MRPADRSSNPAREVDRRERRERGVEVGGAARALPPAAAALLQPGLVADDDGLEPPAFEAVDAEHRELRGGICRPGRGSRSSTPSRRRTWPGPGRCSRPRPGTSRGPRARWPRRPGPDRCPTAPGGASERRPGPRRSRAAARACGSGGSAAGSAMARPSGRTPRGARPGRRREAARSRGCGSRASDPSRDLGRRETGRRIARGPLWRATTEAGAWANRDRRGRRSDFGTWFGHRASHGR